MLTEKFKDRLAKLREKTESITSEHLIPISMKVSESVQKERYDHCNECEFLHKRTNRCTQCGCFMGVKTWLKREKCPLNKWLPDETSTD